MEINWIAVMRMVLKMDSRLRKSHWKKAVSELACPKRDKQDSPIRRKAGNFDIHSYINVDDFIADLQWKTQDPSSVWEGGLDARLALSFLDWFLVDKLAVHVYISI